MGPGWTINGEQGYTVNRGQGGRHLSCVNVYTKVMVSS